MITYLKFARKSEIRNIECSLCGNVYLVGRSYLRNITGVKKLLITIYNFFNLQIISPSIFPFHDLNFLELFHRSKLYYCKECDFGFLGEELNERKLNNFYKKNYWRWMQKNSASLSSPGYRENRHAQYLKNLGATTVIDIGGGNTSFIELFPNLYKILIDPSKVKNKNFKFTVFNNIFNITEPINNGIFRISHVLEHVVDLNIFLSQVHFLLGNNSFLLVEVPNIKNINQFTKEDHGPHTFMFSQTSLEKILKNFNFAIINSWNSNNTLTYLVYPKKLGLSNLT